MGKGELNKGKPERKHGRNSRDEMNLAEFPLAVIGKRPPKGVKTMAFQDEVWDRSSRSFVQRKLTVTGSDLLGLPTSLDDEVLVGCIYLTELHGFSKPRVAFTRFQLLEILGWKTDGPSYRRLGESLQRWAGTLVISDKAYWNKAKKCWVSDSFNILDRVRLYDDEQGSAMQPRSSFVWGDFMWKSFRAGNLKGLDFDFWKGLGNPVSKRLFRLLDKRFYHTDRVTFDLHCLAKDKVGLSRKLHTGEIKRRLSPANDELEKKGVCSATYVKRCRGQWDVVYVKGCLQTKSDHQEEDSLTAVLRARGVTNAQALVDSAPESRIRAAIENFNDRTAHGADLGPGWLVAAVTAESDFEFRPGYISKAERAAKKNARSAQAKGNLDSFDRERERCQKHQRKQHDLFLKAISQLSTAECERLELEGLRAAEANGDKLIASGVRQERKDGVAIADARLLRRHFWSLYILPQAV